MMQDVDEANTEDVTSSNGDVTKMSSSNGEVSRTRKSKLRRDEKVSQTNLCSPLDRPSGDRRTPLKMSASSHAQTSPTSSPKASRFLFSLKLKFCKPRETILAKTLE